MYFVRTGLQGEIGIFDNRSHQRLQRDDRIICQTDRGLELGTVLAAAHESDLSPDFVANHRCGQIVRTVGANDQMLIERLERYRNRAFVACQQLLQQRGSQAVLVDVEQLFDGENLFFYFLGEVDESLEPVLAELSSTYEQRIRFRQFAERLANGCGPDCGTTDRGCSQGGCSTCGLAGACR